MALPLATLSSKFQLEGLFLHGWGGSDAQSPYSGCYPLYHTTNSLLKSFRGCNHSFTQLFYFIYLWLCCVFTAMLGLFLVVPSQGYPPVVVRRLLTAVASLVAEPKL